MTNNEALAFAKNELNLSESDAKEWAEGYKEGFNTAKEIFTPDENGKMDNARITAYWREVGFLENIEGWNKMIVRMAWEIILGYEWNPFIPGTGKWIAWEFGQLGIDVYDWVV
jgi:hypothetical protein